MVKVLASRVVDSSLSRWASLVVVVVGMLACSMFSCQLSSNSSSCGL